MTTSPAPTTSDVALSLRRVVKSFGTLRAVDGLDLDVRAGTCLGRRVTRWA